MLMVRRQRKDFASKAARALIQSGVVVAYEDLKIANMVKHHRLEKEYQCCCVGLFLSRVRYYGQVHGIPDVAVPHSSQRETVEACGYRVYKSLSQRSHVCPNCGLVLDRDQNSAISILDKGLRTRGHQETGQGRALENASGQPATTRGVRKSTPQADWLKEESPVF
jgi:putative transposase